MTIGNVVAKTAALGLIAFATFAGAESGGEVSRKVIERVDIPGSGEELRLMLVEYPPGYSIKPHRHSVAGLCYVIEGAAETQYEGERRRLVKAGESFQDEAEKIHLVFKNASMSAPLRFLCSFKIAKNGDYVLP